ncbi:MAG: prolipoprotein diacylglyceryl transferase [Bacteroidales bacterium]|jgi:prolipoprotein diacylglyceryl transferase|nr:prolipoprotein diacylglyceryl transferase [Bacteroidales bacterium]
MTQIAFISWDYGPEIFRTDFFSLRWYGVLFSVAFVSGYFILRKMFRSEGLPAKAVDPLIWYMTAGTFLGARLGHCLFYEPGYFLHHPLEIFLPFARDAQGTFHFTGYQGLASHGAACGILAALALYSWIERRPYLWILDRIVVVVALSGFFIRMGNLMNSEIYGVQTSLPWGFIFVNAGETVPRHPAQIYEALSYLAIFGLLYCLYFYRRAAVRCGVLSGIFMTTLFSVRFLIEFIKEDQVAFEKSMPLNMGQLLSIPLILAGLFLWIRQKKKQENCRN